MKFIFIIEMGKAVAGGGYALYKYAEELAIMGHEVQIFGLSPENKFIKKQELPQTLRLSDRVYTRGWFKGSGRIDTILDSLYSGIVIRNFIRKHKYDFICGSLRTSAITASILAKEEHIKSVNFVYETPPWMEHDLGSRWFKEYKGRFRKSWERTKQAYLESDILLSTSKLSKDWCEKWLKTKKVDDYIYPGINISDIDSVPKQAEKRQIIYVGRLNTYKNIDLIIKALSRIKNPPAFIVVGEGEERQNLIDLARKLKVNCTFMGSVEETEKWKLIKESLFMVFPSSHEGFGIPPMESLACEKPCICLDKPIFREVYGDHVEYFKENKATALASAINLLLRKNEYRDIQGKNGRIFVEKVFSWKKSAEKIERVLQTLTGLS